MSAIALPTDQSLYLQSVLTIHHTIPSLEHWYAIDFRDQYLRQIHRDHVTEPQASPVGGGGGGGGSFLKQPL